MVLITFNCTRLLTTKQNIAIIYLSLKFVVLAVICDNTEQKHSWTNIRLTASPRGRTSLRFISTSKTVLLDKGCILLAPSTLSLHSKTRIRGQERRTVI